MFSYRGVPMNKEAEEISNGKQLSNQANNLLYSP